MVCGKNKIKRVSELTTSRCNLTGENNDIRERCTTRLRLDNENCCETMNQGLQIVHLRIIENNLLYMLITVIAHSCGCMGISMCTDMRLAKQPIKERREYHMIDVPWRKAKLINE